MSDQEIIQWDKRLADQVRRGWDNYKHLHIDLGVARLDQSYLIAGEYLYVEQSSSADAIAKIKLNRVNNDVLDLEKGVSIETVFIEVFITNDVLEDEWIDLVFGINFKYKKKAEGGGLAFVDRGNIAAFDFVLVDFTTDNAWHDLDLSAIIPAGTKLIRVRLSIRGSNSQASVMLRMNGDISGFNQDRVITQVANVLNEHSVFVIPDENGIIEYLATNIVWNQINFVVCSWFI